MITSHIIDNREDVEAMFDYLKSSTSDVVAYDIETDGLIEKQAKIYGFGLAVEDHEGFYIVIRDKDGKEVFSPEDISVIKNELWTLCSTKKLINHNIIFDVLVTNNNWGIDLTPLIYADTILMKHCIDENPPHGLKETAETYLGAWAVQAQDELFASITANGGKTTKEQCDMYKADTEVLGNYCTWDVVLTLKLYHIFSQKLKDESLEDLFFKDEIMPVYKDVVIPMKDNGFTVDIAHFEGLRKEMIKDISLLEDEIYLDLDADINHYERVALWKKFETKKGGNFPKKLAEVIGIELPKRGEAITLIKKELEKVRTFNKLHEDYLQWMLNDEAPLPETLYESTSVAHLKMFYEKHPDKKRVFNIGSNDQLKWLFFEKWGMTVTDKTPEGNPKLDEEALENLAGQRPIADKIIHLRKLNKLLSTYVDGILERQIDGVLYTSMLLFGTTSGRFASRDPNLNNLPRIKEDDGSLPPIIVKYTNAIRKGLIAPEGYEMIGSDFSSLEPHIAAYVSGDPGLVDIFVNSKDFYSAIGIKQFNIKDASPFPEDKNYFGKLYKALRSLIKTYSLAAFYGATAPRISQVTGKTREESQELLNGYFASFPGVKSFIETTHESAIRYGSVRTLFGRVRHLYQVKTLVKRYGQDLLNYRWAKSRGLDKERSILKNLLNNAVNFQIQGYAAHCLNRAMLKMTKEFKRLNLDARVALPIHDEVLVIARKDDVSKAKEVVKWAMESCVDMGDIKLKATPVVGRSYADCK